MPLPDDLAPYFRAPEAMAGQNDGHRSPLLRTDGSRVTDAAEWLGRRAEIRKQWFEIMGPWPELLAKPRVEGVASTRRENFEQRSVRVEVAAGRFQSGLLLKPDGAGPFPAVFVPFYDPETSAGIGGRPNRDYGLQLVRRGFVILCIGAPGGDAFKPDIGDARCQPLAYLGYIAANCHTVLAQLSFVDPRRIGVVGHSYGGKWAMFASCFYEKFACAAWSDPGVVFEETRKSINYWEPWYLGLDANVARTPGLVSAQNPRTGAYRVLVERGHDLHELHALMAPRPFFVSGGSEDTNGRWAVLRHAIEVNRLLGFENRVGMHNRPLHEPTEESNRLICRFFEHFLQP